MIAYGPQYCFSSWLLTRQGPPQDAPVPYLWRIQSRWLRTRPEWGSAKHGRRCREKQGCPGKGGGEGSLGAGTEGCRLRNKGSLEHMQTHSCTLHEWHNIHVGWVWRRISACSQTLPLPWAIGVQAYEGYENELIMRSEVWTGMRSRGGGGHYILNGTNRTNWIGRCRFPPIN